MNRQLAFWVIIPSASVYDVFTSCASPSSQRKHTPSVINPNTVLTCAAARSFSNLFPGGTRKSSRLTAASSCLEFSQGYALESAPSFRNGAVGRVSQILVRQVPDHCLDESDEALSVAHVGR